jgi:hypothetical protein
MNEDDVMRDSVQSGRERVIQIALLEKVQPEEHLHGYSATYSLAD